MTFYRSEDIDAKNMLSIEAQEQFTTTYPRDEKHQMTQTLQVLRRQPYQRLILEVPILLMMWWTAFEPHSSICRHVGRDARKKSFAD